MCGQASYHEQLRILFRLGRTCLAEVGQTGSAACSAEVGQCRELDSSDIFAATNVGSVEFTAAPGGTAASELAEFGRLSLQAMRAPLLATGAIDADLLAVAQAQLNDSTQDWLSGMEWIAAWGRTPTG